MSCSFRVFASRVEREGKEMDGVKGRLCACQVENVFGWRSWERTHTEEQEWMVVVQRLDCVWRIMVCRGDTWKDGIE